MNSTEHMPSVSFVHVSMFMTQYCPQVVPIVEDSTIEHVNVLGGTYFEDGFIMIKDH